MIDLVLIWNEIAACIPCFSAIMWFSILLIARYDSYTISERYIKHTLLWFFGFCAIVWFSFFIYNYQPAVFVYLNSFVYVAILLMVVIYYRFIYQLTSSDIRKKLPVWHYIVAAIVPGALFIWSFFVPFNVQEALVAERGQLYPGYEAYSVLFLSKPVSLFVYGIVYTVASIRRLFIYYTTAKEKEDAPIRLTRWVIVLMAITVTILLVTFFMLLVLRSRLTSAGAFWGLIVLTCTQHIVLGYNVIRRNLLLCRTSNVTLPPEGKPASIPITKKRFEKYMQSNKPYLNSKLKIADLIHPLQTNRTAISNFVNTTYGINFNRYINDLRLKEVKRLQKMPSNINIELSKLVTIAGFADIRHYRRALHTEQEENASNNLINNKEE